MSPHPVLTVAVEETVEAQDMQARGVAGDVDGGGVVVIGSLRRGQGGLERFFVSLAEAYVHGVEVDWGVLFGEGGGGVGLPTYAFQRERFWLEGVAGGGDASSFGLGVGEHPLLGAVLRLAGEEEGWLFTGRVSLRSHPWLVDHAVMGQVLMPGTGYVELALAAAERVGAGALEELTLERPLLFDGDSAVQIQLLVSDPDEAGMRSVGVFSRRESSSGDELEFEEEWVRHASGVLGEGGEGVSGGQDALAGSEFEGFVGGVWPPEGAEELDTEFLYDRLAEAGYNYGPTFQGLRSAWRVGELYGEVVLEGGGSSESGWVRCASGVA